MNMKINVLRYIFVLPLLALLLVACDDAVTYSEMKEKERDAVNKFVKDKGIKIISSLRSARKKSKL